MDSRYLLIKRLVEDHGIKWAIDEAGIDVDDVFAVAGSFEFVKENIDYLVERGFELTHSYVMRNPFSGEYGYCCYIKNYDWLKEHGVKLDLDNFVNFISGSPCKILASLDFLKDHDYEIDMNRILVQQEGWSVYVDIREWIEFCKLGLIDGEDVFDKMDCDTLDIQDEDIDDLLCLVDANYLAKSLHSENLRDVAERLVIEGANPNLVLSLIDAKDAHCLDLPFFWEHGADPDFFFAHFVEFKRFSFGEKDEGDGKDLMRALTMVKAPERYLYLFDRMLKAKPEEQFEMLVEIAKIDPDLVVRRMRPDVVAKCLKTILECGASVEAVSEILDQSQIVANKELLDEYKYKRGKNRVRPKAH